MDNLERELAALLNRYSEENKSNTPDYQLAEFILSSLDAFHRATQARDAWYGMNPMPGSDWASHVPEQPIHNPLERR